MIDTKYINQKGAITRYIAKLMGVPKYTRPLDS